VTFVVDGVEVTAPAGSMLVDAAKHGDVEIPVFCYEPKLGEPVGACRMCLVEIEGIPKLQTGCSTPVRDGMVVYTRTDRVVEAQSSVVEFLLVNHPLDCPVCDKGGECPLQDIAMGWGPGRSRYTDPKRHFQKPLPLSPLVRIDRERCILCYRCVRFSQEVAEDEQLQLLERGDRTYVGTFDDRPYVAPFHGNIIELCPVGALTSEEYRFRARPWDIEDAGTICTLCPSQCNVKLTVRDEQVKRVLARDNHEVDDGWLCDRGRFGFQMIHSPERITRPMARQGGELRPVSWPEAIEAAANGLREHGSETAALVGGQSSNEEGWLVQRLLRGALGSAHVDSRRAGGAPAALDRELGRPELAASLADVDAADAVLVVGTEPLHEMPILDLRLRKAVRRHGLTLAVASDRPSSLDGGAAETARYTPRDAAAMLDALAAQAAGGEAGGPYGSEADRLVATLGRDSRVVVVYGERVMRGASGEAAGRAILALAEALGLGEREGSGLIEVPEQTNGRGLREAGCLPGAGPGYTEAPAGRNAAGIRDGLEAGDLRGLILCDADPVRDFPDGPGWRRALQAAGFVVAIAHFEDDSVRHADVVFPAETFAEKDGTVTHPDGRLQRVRPNIPHPGEVRPMWQVLVELSAALGRELDLQSYPEVFNALVNDVPFYAGVTLDEIGGQGVRWPERDAIVGGQGGGSDAPSPGTSPPGGGAVSANRAGAEGGLPVEGASAPPPADRALRLGTYRDLWAGEITERNPALRFLAPAQTLEIAPSDAERLGLGDGDEVVVSSNGDSVAARVGLRERLRPGGVFLIEGTREQNANLLGEAETVEVRRSEPTLEVKRAGGGAS
jgi:NADH-quinone oxidoreductase subunit G